MNRKLIATLAIASVATLSACAPTYSAPVLPASLTPSQVVSIVGATLPACVTEDDTDCYWDAASRGNGMGSSFVNINGTVFRADGSIIDMEGN